MFGLGNVILCRDGKVYMVTQLTERITLVDLTTYEIIFPYDIALYIKARHKGIIEVYHHYLDYVIHN